ncbi:MAG: hypothetical protein J6A00_04635 [Bacteroides sp.]|uniref:DUF4373 domain-containing protein n=1 Tax=Phocaeicola sartorii TaxID=671267 RepID=UPI001B0E9ECD|nr:DUF4373 domain-containing protein [Phocaeicola sartorii]MBO5507034.1 hypothetical protein [Bacteroides sp.]
MNTDFIHDRLVRRIMKREGDAALTILLCTLRDSHGKIHLLGRYLLSVINRPNG